MPTPEEIPHFEAEKPTESITWREVVPISGEVYASDIDKCLTPEELKDKITERHRIRIAWLDGPDLTAFEYLVTVDGIQDTDAGCTITFSRQIDDSSDLERETIVQTNDFNKDGRMFWTEEDGVIKTTFENVGYFVRSEN